ncbi:hypothetical protein [Nocardia transvalensis]|uniref:hypothetical protein n=1 Tax=Nocardia transvalensis TaxID=37333 RepID=UPI001894EDAC|nr:hypothetical protein [Nocardia transvalensis]MBF6330139.1 hypothetical protein [Nocardia transvalensis]
MPASHDTSHRTAFTLAAPASTRVPTEEASTLSRRERRRKASDRSQPTDNPFTGKITNPGRPAIPPRRFNNYRRG